ncbi:MAG: hypothetical protein ACXVCF_04900, partial [Isosphaeraceae bacterium]
MPIGEPSHVPDLPEHDGPGTKVSRRIEYALNQQARPPCEGRGEAGKRRQTSLGRVLAAREALATRLGNGEHLDEVIGLAATFVSQSPLRHGGTP